MTLLWILALVLLPPCAAEDSNNCRWDASTMGNGRGASFITVLDRTVTLGE